MVRRKGSNGSWIFRDDVTKIWGKHTFHFGYQYASYFYDESNYSDSGTFNFKPTETSLPGYATQTGNAFASFLLGAVDNATHGIAGHERRLQATLIMRCGFRTTSRSLPS